MSAINSLYKAAAALDDQYNALALAKSPSNEAAQMFLKTVEDATNGAAKTIRDHIEEVVLRLLDDASIYRPDDPPLGVDAEGYQLIITNEEVFARSVADRVLAFEEGDTE